MKLKISFYSLLALILACAVYIHFNPEKVYSSLGNYFFKHNNTQKALYFYEKSFDTGNNNPEERTAFVNLLINSPLDVKAQGRLIKIAEGDINDEASGRARYFLYDLKHEIHNKYPLNYIKQAPYNNKIMHWNKFPVTYTFQNTGPEYFASEINNAFSEWEKQGSVMFSQVKNQNADIVIDFADIKPDEVKYGQKYVIAYTTPEINTNRLEGMKIRFFIHSPDGTIFSRNQIYNTALHEIFHALGFMGHSFDNNNIMYLSSNNSNTADDERRELTEADIRTLDLLYKIKPDITNSGNLKYNYLPYLVLGDGEEVSFSKAREAKNYIRQAPTLPGGYIDLAESYVAQKKYPEAIRCLDKALSLADTDELRYISYYNLAVSYMYIAHYEMALDYVQKAIEIKNTEELHFLLAEICQKQGNTRKAEEEYNYLIKIAPDNADYVINLANIYIKKYNYLKARRILKQFIKKNPNQKDRLSQYGILLF